MVATEDIITIMVGTIMEDIIMVDGTMAIITIGTMDGIIEALMSATTAKTVTLRELRLVVVFSAIRNFRMDDFLWDHFLWITKKLCLKNILKRTVQ